MLKSSTFGKVLPKNKKPGKQKIWIWANTSYNYFFSIQKDLIVSLKLQFFEDIAKTLNSFLVLYHTDNDSPAESLETLFRSLCVKFVRKDVVESAKPDSVLIKLDVADKTNWKNINSVNLGFGIKYESKRLIDSKKVTSMQVFQFKKEAWEFLASLCSHAMEKSPLRYILQDVWNTCPQTSGWNPQDLTSWYLRKFTKTLSLEKIHENLVSCKQLPSREDDAAKLGFSNFLLTTVKENKDSIDKFDKETDCIPTFMWQFLVDSNKFIMLWKVLKMFMILSHWSNCFWKGI